MKAEREYLLIIDWASASARIPGYRHTARRRDGHPAPRQDSFGTDNVADNQVCRQLGAHPGPGQAVQGRLRWLLINQRMLVPGRNRSSLGHNNRRQKHNQPAYSRQHPKLSGATPPRQSHHAKPPDRIHLWLAREATPPLPGGQPGFFDHCVQVSHIQSRLTPSEYGSRRGALRRNEHLTRLGMRPARTTRKSSGSTSPSSPRIGCSDPAALKTSVPGPTPNVRPDWAEAGAATDTVAIVEPATRDVAGST